MQNTDSLSHRGGPPLLLVALLLGTVVATRFLAIAASPGEIDEAVFSGAVTRFDMARLSPQAPGFPLWILIGRAFLPLVPGPFHALAVAATLLSCVGLPALYLWGRRLVGGWAALGAAVFAASLPVVWVNGGRAFSDSPSTAFFLASLASLAAAGERAPEGRRAWPFALVAGLAAAAGAGVRPHLVLAFGPLLLVEAVRASRDRAGRRVAGVLVASGLAGTLAWGLWLLSAAGGVPGILAAVGERAEFRAHAFATGTFGTLLDSFVVKDYLSWQGAAVVLVLGLLGLAATARRSPRAAVDLLLVLVPTFLSLWFLHSRAMSRYSVPFVVVLSLPAAAGVAVLLRRPKLGLVATLAGAGFFAGKAWPEVRYGATRQTPPAAAIAHVARYGDPARHTIIADGVFASFLRTEIWERRLGVWGLTDDLLLGRPLGRNPRLIRLVDLTEEPDPVDRTDPEWHVWRHGGKVAGALGNRRLLTVAVRDPAPPLFGPGFGIREQGAGRPSTRWAGPGARLIIPGLEGPPVAFLRGERPSDEGPTTLTVTDAETGRVLVTRHLVPGAFDLVIVPEPVYGPLPRPREVILTCDRPQALPELPGATRPRSGCVVIREATFSLPPDRLWERLGEERVLDLGRPGDAWAVLEGFHDREVDPTSGLTMRWTSARSSFLWVPSPTLAPREIAFRAKAPKETPVRLSVSIGGFDAGSVEVLPGEFSEARLALDGEGRARMCGAGPVRVELTSPVFVPTVDGRVVDPRELGIILDRVLVRSLAAREKVAPGEDDARSDDREGDQGPPAALSVGEEPAHEHRDAEDGDDGEEREPEP